MRRPVAARALTVALVLGGWSVSPVAAGSASGPTAFEPPTAAGVPRVVTFLDYFETGRRAVEAFVEHWERERPGAELAEVIRRRQQSCVRLEIRLGHDGLVSHSAIASGVLVDGGRRVLTAAHTFRGIETSDVLVTLPGGEVRRARPAFQRYEPGESNVDWALLDLIGPPPEVSADLGRGPLTEGELVFVLGYPDQIGVDASGRLAYSPRAGGEYREPLVTLAAVERTDPLTLSPRVGAIPTVGMSGGPVFDLHGRLVGIFVSVSRIERERGVRHTYGASTITPVLGVLSRR